MIGLSIHITNSSLLDSSNLLNAITSAYRDRVLADGFTVEALDCVNSITNTFQYNGITTAYNARVLSEGFTVEALDCVNTITNTFN
jgi:hypothetical protein